MSSVIADARFLNATCNFSNSAFDNKRFVLNSGGLSEGETPVPIPNTAVKPLSGESSFRATGRKASTLPELSQNIF